MTERHPTLFTENTFLVCLTRGVMAARSCEETKLPLEPSPRLPTHWKPDDGSVGVGVTVYVDNMRAKFGRMVMCHMLADTSDELIAMAALVGISRRWLQDAGEPTEHFDVALSKRATAVRYGAVEVGLHEVAELIRKRSA